MDKETIKLLEIRKEKLEARKQDIMNWKFMGGGFGLFFFLFISMGFGIIIWIISYIANQNELERVNVEIAAINSQLESEAVEVKVKNV